ncbi:MAG: hypothetical protein PF690_17885 [Deltaproteobacteria bacterium]|jgi:hypothetical protein|nr:hypothetical protein [Deltaproteobacteria bacterium]
MKAKPFILIMTIVAVIGGLVFFFQKDKQDKKLIAHNKLKFQQVRAAAQKSNIAGLLVMASTINKFHKIKGYYPKKLFDLYPEFITDISFISKLNWSYHQEKKSYLIKRNVTGQNTFASMGPDLKLKTGTKESATQRVIIADVQTKIKKTKSIQAATPENLKTKSGIKKHAKLVQEVEKKFKSTVKKVLPNVSTEPEPSTRIVKKALNKNEQFLLSLNNSNFYIWKDSGGIIGFSNMQYPNENQLFVYRDQGWIEYSAK